MHQLLIMARNTGGKLYPIIPMVMLKTVLYGHLQLRNHLLLALRQLEVEVIIPILRMLSML